MKLLVPAIATHEPGAARQESAQSTSHLLEEIDALLAQNALLQAQGGGGAGGRGPRPFMPAA